MIAPCNRPTVDYTGIRSLENSHRAEPRPERSGFFVSVHQANSACYPVSMPGGLGNTQYPAPSLCGFEPPGAHHPGGLQFSTERKPL